jgi:hypothetical protein
MIDLYNHLLIPRYNLNPMFDPYLSNMVWPRMLCLSLKQSGALGLQVQLPTKYANPSPDQFTSGLYSHFNIH